MDTGKDERLDLGDTRKLGLLWHRRLLFLVRRCALAILEMVRFTKAAGPRVKEIAPPLFLCSFADGYFTYTGILAPGLES